VVIASRAFLSKASGRKQRNASPCHRRHAGDQKQMRGGFDFLAFHNNKTNTSQNPHFFEKKNLHFYMGRKLRITTPRQQNSLATRRVLSWSRACTACLLSLAEGGNKQTALFDPCILGQSRHQSKKKIKGTFPLFLEKY